VNLDTPNGYVRSGIGVRRPCDNDRAKVTTCRVAQEVEIEQQQIK